MLKQPFCNFMLAGISLCDFGLKIPSPFTKLTLTGAQILTETSWSLNCTVTGDAQKSVNIAAFEALLYSAAQNAAKQPTNKGIPVSFLFGWLDAKGNVNEYLSYQGYLYKYTVNTSGNYIQYTLTGLASRSQQSHMPVLRIPAICGIVQPSAVVEAVAKAAKATTYYMLDIDHNDVPTLVNHAPLTTSFNSYVRGEVSARDEYDNFPGLLRLSKSYNATRVAGGLKRGIKKISTLVNNLAPAEIKKYLRVAEVDTSPQCLPFSFWVDEPTMTRPGIIHYKSNASRLTTHAPDVLQFGTSTSNIMSLSGKYDGIAYNLTDMNFTQLGFAVDASGNTIAESTQVVNSWAADLPDVFQTANIINDINALASQFAEEFTVVIAGATRDYELAQPVSLVVMSGNTLSPITGVYNIMAVTHEISSTFLTTLRIQRLSISTANQTAAAQNIYVSGSSQYRNNSFTKTPNIITPYKVQLPDLYPNYENIG